MAKGTGTREGYGKLLDCWTPPEGAGAPIGCIATSFTFSPAFYEEECLGRFLNLETEPNEDGPLYLIEREEKLSQLVCGCALVDQHHCQGPRSLRWDLIAARPVRGILHAKVSLLHWSESLRAIVTSANLTEDGYRRNREVYSVLDFHPGGTAPLACLRELVSFLRDCLATSELDTKSTTRERAEALLSKVEAVPDTWGRATPSRNDVAVNTVFTGPGRRSALDALKTLWPMQRPPNEAIVTSPFFDAPENASRPTEQLWSVLTQRGWARLAFNVEAEEIPDQDLTLIHAPQSLKDGQPKGSRDIDTEFRALDPNPQRPLHAKTVVLSNDKALAYMLGSSNFTSAGMGISTHSNYEANLVYTVRADRNKSATRQMMKAQLDAEPVPDDSELRFQAVADRGEDSAGDESPLPLFFKDAILSADSDGTCHLEFRFGKGGLNAWAVSDEDNGTLYSKEDWDQVGAPDTVKIPWSAERLPSGLWVHWNEGNKAWWAVNVASHALLPPPEELRNLPLDVLIRVLTSARPLHRVLKDYLKDKFSGNGDPSPVPVHLDPHKRVDTSRFLLQRTRRVSGALNGIRDRLERPVPCEQSLHWRLYGPVGVTALADALEREATSPEEQVFLLGELILELSRVTPQSARGCLSSDEVRDAIGQVARDLQRDIRDKEFESAKNLKRYLDSVATLKV